MLSRLPVMQPIDSQPEATPTTGCDATEPEAKRTKRTEEHNPFAVFQEVRSGTTRQSKTSHHAELQPCRSQIRETLDANRQRETKWTTDAELRLLMEFWGRMARRQPRTFDFAFRSHETSETVDLNFTKEAVKWKLKQLKKALRVPGAHASRRSGCNVSNVPAAPRRRQPAGGAQASKPRSTTRF